MGGSDPFSFTSDSDAPIRIHCKTEAKKHYPGIEKRWGRQEVKRRREAKREIPGKASGAPRAPKKVVEQMSEIQKSVKWRLHSKHRPRSLHIYSGS